MAHRPLSRDWSRLYAHGVAYPCPSSPTAASSLMSYELSPDRFRFTGWVQALEPPFPLAVQVWL